MKTIITALVLAFMCFPALSHAQTGTSTPQQLTLLSTLLQMPDYGHFYQSSVPLLNAYYKDGYFLVASGACVPRTYGPDSRGQWVFTEAGQLVGEQDVCDDGEVPSIGIHDWSVSPKIQFQDSPAGLNFVREIEWSGFGRGLLSYSVSGSSVSFMSGVPGPSGENPQVPYQGNPSISSPALTSTGYVAAARQDGSSRSNDTYRFPSLSPESTKSYSFRPVTGFGPYVVGTRGFGNDTNLYRIDARGDLTLVETLIEDNAPGGYTFDESSVNPRLVLYVPRQNGGTVSNDTLYTFEIQGEDVVEVSSKTVAQAIGSGRPSMLGVGDGILLAVSGEYIATTGLGGTSGSIEVWKNGARIAKATLPDSRDQQQAYSAEPVIGIAMSPAGKILAVNRYGAYLYQLGGVIPPGTQTPPITPQTPVDSAASVTEYLSIASSYLRVLQQLFGGQPGVSPIGPSSPATDAIYQEAFRR